MDGGVDGVVVVDGIALRGAVDFCFAIFVSLNTDADEGTAEPCCVRLGIEVGNESYGSLSFDVVDVTMSINSIERE